MIDQKLVNKAIDILRHGGLVAIPTETVYGLGADASNAAAVARVFAAKGRPADHPLIVHVASVDQLGDWAREVPEAALKLARAFWPGSLTMILKKQPGVLDSVTGGQDSIGLRIPNHPLALSLLQAFGGGVAAPSANRFAHISPTSAAAVREELGDKVDMILDGGDCIVGLESTIIDMTQSEPVILRPGMISAAAIESVLGAPVKRRRTESNTVRVPGMHHVHYAPTKLMRMAETNEIAGLLEVTTLPVTVVTWSDVSLTGPHRPLQPRRCEERFLRRSNPASKSLDCFAKNARNDEADDEAVASSGAHANIRHVRMVNDPAQYAHDLYHVLRELDHTDTGMIIVEAVPEAPEWEAIRDRLTKASAK